MLVQTAGPEMGRGPIVEQQITMPGCHQPAGLVDILRFFLARSDNRPTSQIHGLATHLKAIARHHVGVPPMVAPEYLPHIVQGPLLAMQVHRDVFAAWCDRMGWERPAFWFSQAKPSARVRATTAARTGCRRLLHELVSRGKRDRIAAYVAALQRANAPRTVLNRLTDLATVLRWFAPEQDWDWLHRCLAKLRARAQPVRDKRARLRSARELLTLGRQLAEGLAGMGDDVVVGVDVADRGTAVGQPQGTA